MSAFLSVVALILALALFFGVVSFLFKRYRPGQTANPVRDTAFFQRVQAETMDMVNEQIQQAF